jgi:tRNA modification GTPase
MIELHCHGGLAAVERIIGQLQSLGFEVVRWEQAVQQVTADPLAANAAIALAAASTQRTAVILLDQMHGALRCALERTAALLRSGAADAARTNLDELFGRARLGLHLTRPWRIVLSGPPNVGKSSLANALLGYSRAIVDSTPGTTRDVVTAVTAFEGWPVEFADTAGQRNSVDPLEQAGIARAQAAVAKADLVLEVLVAREAAGASLLPSVGHHARLRVFNKVDLLPPGAEPPPGLAVSALTGQGLERLQQAIVTALVPQPSPPGAAVPFTAAQVEALEAALSALHRGDAAQAAAFLDQLLFRQPS